MQTRNLFWHYSRKVVLDMEDGYIKFKCTLHTGEPPDAIFIRKLNAWRTKLHQLDLLGEYPNGVGFGNISRRFKNDTFIISGSATGGIPELSNMEYVRVDEFNVHTSTVSGTGLIQPSSESMTHGIIYKTLPAIKCVLHVHDRDLWLKYKNILPTSAEHIAYGTPEMALAVKQLVLSLSAQKAQVVIMGGHEEGVIVYGASPDDAGNRLLKLKSSAT